MGSDLSNEEAMEKFQKTLLERSRLQALINVEEMEKSEVQLKLMELVKNLENIKISLMRRESIRQEFEELIKETDRAISRILEEQEPLLEFIKKASNMEIEKSKAAAPRFLTYPKRTALISSEGCERFPTPPATTFPDDTNSLPIVNVPVFIKCISEEKNAMAPINIITHQPINIIPLKTTGKLKSRSSANGL